MKYIKMIILIILNFLIYFLIKKYWNSVCKNFYNGYRDYKINNDKEKKILFYLKTKKMWYSYFKWINLLFLFISSCKNRDNDKKRFIKFSKVLIFQKMNFIFL